MYGDTCEKCGEVGEDRRTLWMACFYEMSELDLPFEEVEIRGTLHEVDHVERRLLFEDGPTLRHTIFKDEPVGTKDRHNFYTMRVCKECRASWMSALKAWFQTPKENPESCGTGIFVRENGVNREITMEEWEHRQAQRRAKQSEE